MKGHRFHFGSLLQGPPTQAQSETQPSSTTGRTESEDIQHSHTDNRDNQPEPDIWDRIEAVLTRSRNSRSENSSSNSSPQTTTFTVQPGLAHPTPVSEDQQSRST